MVVPWYFGIWIVSWTTATVNYLHKSPRKYKFKEDSGISIVYLWLGHSCTSRKQTVVLQHVMLVGLRPHEPETLQTWGITDPGLHGPGASRTRDLADPRPSGRIPASCTNLPTLTAFSIHSNTDLLKYMNRYREKINSPYSTPPRKKNTPIVI